jgi:sterol 3beta-glucosyltransferase
MHIAILTMGSRGDVQPYVALGVGLRNVGHKVTLATFANFEPFVRQHGLDFAPIAGDIRELLETDEGREVLNTAGRPLHLMRGVRRVVCLVEPLLAQIVRDVWQACQGADRVVAASLLYYYGDYMAHILDVPLYLSSHGPKAPTRAFPQLWFPDLPAWLPVGEDWYNLLTHHVAQQLLGRFKSPLLARPWRAVFGEPLPATLSRRPLPTLYCYSPAVLPKPVDWNDQQHVTGYWFLDGRSDWQPSAELVDFLQAGSPPVCVGFGSMGSNEPEEMTRMVVGALRRSRQRGILLTGWGGLRAGVQAISHAVYLSAHTPVQRGAGHVRRLSPRQAAHLLDQLVGQIGLEDELIGSGFQALPAAIHRRRHDQWNVGHLTQRPHLAHQVNRLPAVYLDVHQHGIWKRLVEQ